MENDGMVKKVVIGLIILAAIVVGVVYVLPKLKKTSVAPANNAAEVAKPVAQKTEVPVDKTPDKFPTGIPIEAGADITQNYNATATDGRFQATRAFITKKTLAENLTIYKDWMNANGWTIGSSIDQPTYKMVAGTKGKQELQASISENSATKDKTVTLSMTIVP